MMVMDEEGDGCCAEIRGGSVVCVDGAMCIEEEREEEEEEEEEDAGAARCALKQIGSNAGLRRGFI